jgi:prefoldin subunit 5
MWSCGQKDHQHDGHDHAGDPVKESGNTALDREVMKIHDEAMAKMDEIYKLKQDLKKQIEEAPAMAAEKKAEIEMTIAKLDSANDGMMNWMHQYKPIADSVFGEEKAREYLEGEIEKIKKVRQDMFDAIDKAKAKNP